MRDTRPRSRTTRREFRVRSLAFSRPMCQSRRQLRGLPIPPEQPPGQRRGSTTSDGIQCIGQCVDFASHHKSLVRIANLRNMGFAENMSSDRLLGDVSFLRRHSVAEPLSRLCRLVGKTRGALICYEGRRWRRESPRRRERYCSKFGCSDPIFAVASSDDRRHDATR